LKEKEAQAGSFFNHVLKNGIFFNFKPEENFMKFKRFCRSAAICRNLLLFTIVFIMAGTSFAQTVTWMRTSSGGDRCKAQSLSFHAAGTAATVTITVNPSQTYQTMMGFGGSFTESAALAMNALTDPAVHQQAIDAYFGPSGANYSICRAQMGASDFSAGLYSFDDQNGDFALTNFSVQHDVPTIIKYMKDALARNPDLKIFGSPWSAPAWMKTNNNMNNGGNLKGDANTQNAWALYFVKYVQAYKAQGVPIWGITIQNEPQAVQTWPSMIFTDVTEHDFLKNYLGPKLAANALGPDKLAVMFWDHNKDVMVQWANTFYNDPVTSAMVWGEAIHWYSGDNFNNVLSVYNSHKGKHILATEQCITGGPHPGEYASAESYAHDIFGDLLNGCEGWVDWNLALNTQGGPNVSSNWCSAGILVNTGAHTFSLNPLYYYMVQFSKYCRPGAVRIGATASGTNAPEVMAFKNPDNSIVVIAHNAGNSSYNARVVNGSNQIEYSTTAQSMDDFYWSTGVSVVNNNTVAPSKNTSTAGRHVMGLNKTRDQQNTSAAKYSITGKRLSESVASHVTPGVYVDKPGNKTETK
jgi:glucosylceramidase